MTKQTTDHEQGRKTTLIVAGALLLLASWNLYRHRLIVSLVPGSMGVALAAIGLLAPSAARAFHKAWMKFAAALGYINSRVLLFLLFYLARGVRVTGFRERRRAKRASSLSAPSNPVFWRQAEMSLLREIWEFLRERKKFWLLPIIIVLLLFGVLMIFASTSALAPFIYTVF